MAEWMMYRYTTQTAAHLNPLRPRTAAEPGKQWDLTPADALGRTISEASSNTSPSHAMDAARGSISSSSTQGTKDDSSGTVSSPFVLRHGRRYLKGLPYPLPCDLPELQRQNLHTLLATSVFGKAICSPFATKTPPKKVLEIACGSGYWSSLCHEYFAGLGYPDIEFTGLDIVHMAGDLTKQGVNWRFVQHDLQRVPLPFDDGEFDLVVMKDLSLVVPSGTASQRVLDECVRIVKKGGTLECWEVDHIIRSLLPHPPPPPGKNPEEYSCAVATGTFLISPGTPFTNAQNKFLQDSNTWIQEALNRLKLYPTPCTRMTQVLSQEPDTLSDVGYRRVAIPLGELRWERDGYSDRNPSRRRESEPSKSKRRTDSAGLTEDQAALRYTALLVVIQLIESLEPLLKEVSGKNQEEWQRWWAWMMTDLLEQKNASSGECLEIGAWWARKV